MIKIGITLQCYWELLKGSPETFWFWLILALPLSLLYSVTTNFSTGVDTLVGVAIGFTCTSFGPMWAREFNYRRRERRRRQREGRG